MNEADRIALIERLARGIAWTTLADAEQNKARRDAEALVFEIEVASTQSQRIGWILIDMPVESDAES